MHVLVAVVESGMCCSIGQKEKLLVTWL